jgi:hypothetical protein
MAKIMLKCLMLGIQGDLLHQQIRYFQISHAKDRLLIAIVEVNLKDKKRRKNIQKRFYSLMTLLVRILSHPTIINRFILMNNFILRHYSNLIPLYLCLTHTLRRKMTMMMLMVKMSCSIKLNRRTLMI